MRRFIAYVLGGCWLVWCWQVVTLRSHISEHDWLAAELVRHLPTPDNPLGVWQEDLTCRRCGTVSVGLYVQKQRPY